MIYMYIPSVCFLIPGTLTLAPSPNAVGVLVSSLSLSFELDSFSTTEVVLLKTGEFDFVSVLDDDKALPAAAAAAKGEAVAFANEPNVGTEEVVLLALSLAILVLNLLSTAVLSFKEG